MQELLSFRQKENKTVYFPPKVEVFHCSLSFRDYHTSVVTWLLYSAQRNDFRDLQDRLLSDRKSRSNPAEHHKLIFLITAFLPRVPPSTRTI